MNSDQTNPPQGAVDFGLFYRERWAELRTAFGWASSLGIDPDDIVQDTMMRAREHYQRFASEVELVLWCRRVGVNLIRRQARTAYRRRERPHPSPLTAAADSTLANVEEQAVENVDFARTIALLPPRHAQVLLLGAAGHSRDEIASILNISPAAAGMLLQRARKAARERWAKVVAGLGLLTIRLRKPQEISSTSAQALAASAMSMSVVAALTLASIPSQSGQAVPVRHLVRASTPVAGTTDPLVAMSGGKTKAPEAAIVRRTQHGVDGVAVKSGPARPGLPVRVPRHRDPCQFNSQSTRGDRIYLKRTNGVCDSNGAESVTPICQYVVDNPVAGCQRTGNPRWNIDPPPESASREHAL